MIFLRQIQNKNLTKSHKFYTNLYDTDPRDRGSLSTNECLSNISTNVLTDEQRRFLDDKISSYEYLEALKSFQTTKTPGNDGLTVEFYLGFWYLVGKCFANSVFKFCTRTGTIIQLAETGYDYFARKERQTTYQKRETDFCTD